MRKILAFLVLVPTLAFVLNSCETVFYASAQTTASPIAHTVEVISPPIVGTNVPGKSLTEKLVWLQRNAESHNTYIIEVSANENIAPNKIQYNGAINITVVIRGDTINRTIRLSNNGTMFTISSDVTFILDKNITIAGHNQNTNSMINVDGGIFIMNGGATITGNSTNSKGGGVNITSGKFEMTGGTISGNKANIGGGVNIDSRGSFEMIGGIISSNTASNGGGVYWKDPVGKALFLMKGGTISNNTAKSRGGGIYANYGTFTMNGGTITGNTAGEYGGGIYFDYVGFKKTGGIITGYNSDQNNGNTVKDQEGIIARRGHAVYFDGSFRGVYRKETTAGPRINLDWTDKANWDE